MLTINTRNDKLTATRIDFSSRGMLNGTCLGEALKNLRNSLEDIDSSSSDMEDGSDSGGEDGEDLNADEDEDGTGLADGSPTLSEVALASTRGESYLLFHTSNHF